MSLNLLVLAVENVFKELSWKNRKINVVGRYLSHLRFTDEIVVITDDIVELKPIPVRIYSASNKTGLKMNLTKTKFRSKEDI